MTNIPGDSSTTKEGLLACPFCGEDIFIELRDNCFVHCMSCGADGPVSDHGDQEDGQRSIVFWNNRTPTNTPASQSDAMVCKLRGEMLKAVNQALRLNPCSSRTELRRAAAEYASIITAIQGEE